MNAISVIQDHTRWAHELLEMVTADVTPEQAHWIPPGIANPLGALYVHAVCSEDGVVNAMLKGGAPMFASAWAGKTGASEPIWELELERARSVKVNLPAFRQYAQAVYAATNEYVALLSENDLTRVVDLSNVGMGQRSVNWILAALLVSHLNNMSGEISALKGIQGAKGYPF